MVYIREAHPSDGWAVPQNEKAGIDVKDPKTIEDREKVASTCIEKLKLSIPAVIDDMKDTANKSYSAWPDRIFVIGKDGKIAYRGGQGPGGFKADELEKELKKMFPDVRVEEDK